MPPYNNRLPDLVAVTSDRCPHCGKFLSGEWPIFMNEFAGMVNFLNPALDKDGRWKTSPDHHLPSYFKGVSFRELPTLAFIPVSDKKKFKATEDHFYHCNVAFAGKEVTVSVKPSKPVMTRLNWVRSKLHLVDEHPGNTQIPPNRSVLNQPKLELTPYYRSKYYGNLGRPAV